MGITARLQAIWDHLRRQGPADLFLLLLFRWVLVPAAKALGLTRRALARSTLRCNGRRTIVLVATIDFRFPYWQRMHHLANELSSSCNVLYVSPGKGFDRFLTGTGRITDTLFVTTDFQAARTIFSESCFLMLSVDEDLDRRVRQLQSQNSKLVYDYIDALHADVDRKMIAPQRLRCHHSLLADESVCVVATARTLFAEVACQRQQRFALITNGVTVENYADIKRELNGLSAQYARLVHDGKPLLGFFGSLAVWLDYALLISVARLRQNYNFVLIGKPYDTSLERVRFDFPPNLHVHPRVPYVVLPRYAAWFDVSLLPFVRNVVTDATSPLKIFEYMALGKPIVSTDIKEVAHYRSPLVGTTPEEFADMVDIALQLANDAAYVTLLREEAAQNSWRNKAIELLSLLDMA